MGIKLAKPTAKQKSLILSVLAGIGVVATGVVSAKCAKKTSDDMSLKEKAKKYIPAFVTGGATIGCIAASTYISHEEITAVTAACVALGQRFANYKKSVEEVATQEQIEQIDRAFYEREIERLEQELAEREHPTDEDDLATFVDSFTGYTFKARKDDVEAGLKRAENLYKEQEFLPWCDIFYLANSGDDAPYNSILGGGNKWWYDYGYGWSKEMFRQFYDEDDPKDLSIDLTEMEERENTYILEYSWPPEVGFMEY